MRRVLTAAAVGAGAAICPARTDGRLHPVVKIAADRDCGVIYADLRRELVALVGALDDERRAMRVPATPEWSVQDVVAHLTGIAVDLNAQDFGDGDPDAWTAIQVVSRRGSSFAAIAAEWDAASPVFEDGLRLLGDEIGTHFVGDLLQHAQDVRSTVGAGRITDVVALETALGHYARTADTALAAAGLGVAVLGPSPLVLGIEPVTASVTVELFELVRLLGGRRSAAQAARLDWYGDAARVVSHLSAYPMPVTDLFD